MPSTILTDRRESNAVSIVFFLSLATAHSIDLRPRKTETSSFDFQLLRQAAKALHAMVEQPDANRITADKTQAQY